MPTLRAPMRSDRAPLRVFLCVCLLCSSPVGALAQAPRNPRDPQSVLDAQRARFSALVAGDLARLGSLLSGDLTYTHSTAVVESRTQFLDTLRSGRTRYLEMTPSDVVVRLYGDVAIATGRVHMRVATPERELAFNARFTEVYRWRDDGWTLAAWQSTRLDP